MSGLTKLGLALLLVFSLSLLGFFSEILYVIWRRRQRLRRSSASGDPEIPCASGGGSSSKELLFYFLCWKNKSRVEPASSAAASPAFSAAAALAAPSAAMTKTASSAAVEEEFELARWHAMCFGPSRVLYTIKEEREEVESDGGMGVSGDGEGDELAETPFSTPCASPAFYTPTSSPPRASVEAGRDPEFPSGGEESGAVSPVAERA